jgi:hypothetical protein
VNREVEREEGMEWEKEERKVIERGLMREKHLPFLMKHFLSQCTASTNQSRKGSVSSRPVYCINNTHWCSKHKHTFPVTDNAIYLHTFLYPDHKPPLTTM